jgi:putative transposase
VVFGTLAAAIEHYVKTGRWWVSLFLAMPDHWHALVSFPSDENMATVVRDWKRFTAKSAGVQWQDGFFDHRLRANESREEKWHYILANPVRAGLIAECEKWPYCWIPDGLAAD